jgi:Fe-S oxidoreductase
MGILKQIKKKLGDYVYFPGCVTHFKLPNIEKNYKRILHLIQVNVLQLDEEDSFICCGAQLVEQGYPDEFEELQEKFKEQINSTGATKIITNSPLVFHTIRKYYPTYPSTFILQLLHKNLNKLNFKKDEKDITYLDSQYIGRFEGIYEEPREILRKIGYNLIEFDKNREEAYCSGAEGGMKENSPQVAKEVAKRLFKKLSTKILVTADPIAYLHLKENAPKGVEVYEISELITKALEN